MQNVVTADTNLSSCWEYSRSRIPTPVLQTSQLSLDNKFHLCSFCCSFSSPSIKRGRIFRDLVGAASVLKQLRITSATKRAAQEDADKILAIVSPGSVRSGLASPDHLRASPMNYSPAHYEPHPKEHLSRLTRALRLGQTTHPSSSIAVLIRFSAFPP